MVGLPDLFDSLVASPCQDGQEAAREQRRAVTRLEGEGPREIEPGGQRLASRPEDDRPIPEAGRRLAVPEGAREIVGRAVHVALPEAREATEVPDRPLLRRELDRPTQVVDRRSEPAEAHRGDGGDQERFGSCRAQGRGGPGLLEGEGRVAEPQEAPRLAQAGVRFDLDLRDEPFERRIVDHPLAEEDGPERQRRPGRLDLDEPVDLGGGQDPALPEHLEEGVFLL